MVPLLASILATGVVHAKDGTPRPIHSQISREEGEFVEGVIRKLKPRRSIEIGCAYGVSSLFICGALAEVGSEQYVIVDPYQLGSNYDGPDSGYEGIGLENIRRAGFAELVEFIGEISYQCLPRLVAEKRKFDFAFVDGMHTFDYAFVDFFFIDKMLNVGGVIVFDDLNYPSIRKLCRYILRNLPYRCIGPITDLQPILKRLANRLASVPLVRRFASPELIVSDRELGLPATNYVAMEKRADDMIADHGRGTRRWDAHCPF